MERNYFVAPDYKKKRETNYDYVKLYASFNETTKLTSNFIWCFSASPVHSYD